MSKTQDGSARKSGKGLAEPRESGDEGHTMLRVGVVAEDPLRVLGLQAILEAHELTVAGERRRVAVVPVALTGLRESLELSAVMLETSGTDHLFEVLATLRRERPGLKMVVVGATSDPEYIRRVIGAGARGYLTREAGEAEIRMALEIVTDGSVWAPRKVLARLLDHRGQTSGAAEERVGFTVREVQVLRALVAGMANREIAGEMGIDESTVKAHLSRLMRKVGAKNRIELMVHALRHGFTERVGSVTGKSIVG